VYARLTLDVGAENVARMARKLGVQTPLGVKTRTGGIAYVNSIGLGSREVSPLDMASAYATLAAGGIRSRPMAITKVILPNGKEDTKAGWGKRSASA
jgi:membrane peptidoglycan carboxypeptidase